MQKSKALLAILLTLAVIGGAGGHAFAVSPSIDWDKCNAGKCFVEVPNLQQTPYTFPPFLTSANKQMDIFLPDGSCNLSGRIQSDGSCNIGSIILTIDNYTRLQNNVAFMAVVNIKDTNAGENVPYCKLAQGIWNGQTDTYQKKLENVTQFVVPNSCISELGSAYKVPEFGAVASIVLAISVMSMVVFVAKVRGTPKF